MGAELLTDRPPGGVNAGLQEPVLDGRQQVVGQHTQENMRLRPVFEVMKNGPLHQRTLQVSKGIFHARQQHVGAPDLIGRQILPVGLQDIAAV